MLIGYLSSLILNFAQIFTKRKLTLVKYITFCFIVFFIGTETTHGDSFNYYLSYNSSVSRDFDIEYIYILLEKLGNFFNLNFYTFRLLLTFLFTTLIFSTIDRYSQNKFFVYFFLLTYIVFIDAIQFRNYIAFSLIVYAFRFLSQKDNLWQLKYIFFVLLASGIHISSIIYLLLLLVNTNNKEKLIRTLVILTFVLTLFTILNDNQIPFINTLVSLFSRNDKITDYLSTTTRLGFLLPLALHLLNIFSIHLTRNIVEFNPNTNMSDSKNLHIIKLIYWINVVSLVFIPLYITNVNFYRLSRNYIILNLIANSIALESLNKNIIKQIFFTVFILVVMMAWYYFDFVYGNPSGDIISNLFFGKSLF